jgi:hypothetical protein
MFIVLTGHRLVYGPSAIVRHVHRADLAGLSRRVYAYGYGCTAALTAILLGSATARVAVQGGGRRGPYAAAQQRDAG